MKYLVLIISVLSFSACHSQTKKIENLNADDYDMITIFLNQQEVNSYVDMHVFKKNRINLFNGKYIQHKKYFSLYDSICRNDRDTTRLKFYCPLAHGFKMYQDVLTQKDLDYLLAKYGNQEKQDMTLLEMDSIMPKVMLNRHSKEYYDEIDYGDYGKMSTRNEFPSIQIDNIYFTERKEVAIIAYTLIIPTNESVSNFYILKKIDGIWWKPIGTFKL
ncbi:MAG: hypothetical protein KTR22_14965 [Flavobacteriaceae bacterium]|nr:hypothetical protein [Flavobacteriaceae bacterium]